MIVRRTHLHIKIGGIDMLSEKDMEDAICTNPEKYLGEPRLRLIARQYRIGSYIFDLLFEDRHGAKLIVEIQKGTLDRTHTYKLLDYYDEFKEIILIHILS
jgi:RecB family endonuclease NucS